jgi:hypothetical protein
MGPVRHFWQADCAALGKYDPVWLLGRIESRIAALERRYSQWGSDPGTPAELRAIQNALSALQRLMNETLARYEEASQRIVGVQLTYRPSLPPFPVLIPPPKNLPST